MKFNKKILLSILSLILLLTQPVLGANITVSDNVTINLSGLGRSFTLLTTSEALDQIEVNTAATAFTITTNLSTGIVAIKSDNGIDMLTGIAGAGTSASQSCNNTSTLTIQASLSTTYTIVVTPTGALCSPTTQPPSTGGGGIGSLGNLQSQSTSLSSDKVLAGSQDENAALALAGLLRVDPVFASAYGSLSEVGKKNVINKIKIKAQKGGILEASHKAKIVNDTIRESLKGILKDYQSIGNNKLEGVYKIVFLMKKTKILPSQEIPEGKTLSKDDRNQLTRETNKLSLFKVSLYTNTKTKEVHFKYLFAQNSRVDFGFASSLAMVVAKKECDSGTYDYKKCIDAAKTNGFIDEKKSKTASVNATQVYKMLIKSMGVTLVSEDNIETLKSYCSNSNTFDVGESNAEFSSLSNALGFVRPMPIVNSKGKTLVPSASSVRNSFVLNYCTYKKELLNSSAEMSTTYFTAQKIGLPVFIKKLLNDKGEEVLDKKGKPIMVPDVASYNKSMTRGNAVSLASTALDKAAVMRGQTSIGGDNGF